MDNPTNSPIQPLQPTPAPQAAPSNPANNNIQDLIYKTMPKADGSAYVRPAPQSYTPAAAPAASGAVPRPAPQTPPPSPNLMSQKPTAPSSGLPGMPTELTRVSQQPPSNNSLVSNFAASGGSKSSKLKLILAIVLGALCIGGGVYAYFQLKPKPATPTTDTNVLPAGNIAQQPAAPQSQIPDDWRIKYFGAAACSNPDNCGDDADPDHDGLTNLQEYQNNTDPNNADSDNDGLADGDEVNVFMYDPTTNDTSKNPKYLDTAEPAAKWNAKAGRLYNSQELQAIAQAIAKFGLHSPTTKTLDPATIQFYTGSSAQTSSSTPTPAPGALDRDTQRSDAIKQIGFALLKYKQANIKYPDTNDFSVMISDIKPLLTGKAVNTTDPVNTGQEVYGYQSVNHGADFKLSYFSETQNQLVVLQEADVQKLSIQADINQRDLQRKADLEQIETALSLYSNDNIDGTDPNQHIYPTQDLWKSALAPQYINAIPTDPLTHKDYVYTTSSDNSSFAIQAVLENPPTGKKGYVCGPDSCDYY